MRAKRDNGDEGIAQMLEAAADEINATEAKPNWDELIKLLPLVKSGALSADEALARATKLVPDDQPYLLERYRTKFQAAVAARSSSGSESAR